MNALYQYHTRQNSTTSTTLPSAFSNNKINLQNSTVMTRSYQDAKEAISDFQSQASRAEQLVLGKIQFNEFTLPLYIVLEDLAASAISRDDLHLLLTGLASTLNQQVVTSDRQPDCTPNDIYPNVEAALKDYYNLARLSQNPLTHILNLDKFDTGNDLSSQASGRGLRALLDKVLDTITGPKPGLNLTAREKWRVEHYLHLRYREEIEHQELVLWMGYSQRALLRKRRSLILDMAALMIQEAMCH